MKDIYCKIIRFSINILLDMVSNYHIAFEYKQDNNIENKNNLLRWILKLIKTKIIRTLQIVTFIRCLKLEDEE